MFTTIGMLRRMTGMTLSLYFFKKFSFISGCFFAGAFFSAEKPAAEPKNRQATEVQKGYVGKLGKRERNRKSKVENRKL